mmetsp:Transcript_33219/g.51931  ORF Transcript_33219/g.51931 Transcript_33219/m.51931 type:complete len:103 (+) Transcript_33219:106-414(+)
MSNNNPIFFRGYRDRGFVPRRPRIPSNSRYCQLRTLIKARENESVNIRYRVEVPPDVEINEWFHYHTLIFFDTIKLIYGTIRYSLLPFSSLLFFAPSQWILY